MTAPTIAVRRTNLSDLASIGAIDPKLLLYSLFFSWEVASVQLEEPKKTSGETTRRRRLGARIGPGLRD